MASNALFIRLYLDEDVHPDLADALRQRGFDCQTAAEAGMRGRLDEEQLTYASSQGRCLLGFNVGDYATLAKIWSQTGRSHCGIVMTNQVRGPLLGQLLHRVLQLLNTYTADEMRDVYLHI